MQKIYFCKVNKIYQLIYDIIYFSGYRQNELYFREYEAELRNLFKFNLNSTSDKENTHLLKHIKETNSVSIHIRRGDYLIYPLYVNLTTQYYENAIKMIKSLIKTPVFFIFSDDICWAKKNIKIENAFFVENNFGKKSYLDMFLMSQCKSNIIANSTFSWWAAWLNENKHKKVIVPSKWFTEPININGLLLSNYIKLDSL